MIVKKWKFHLSVKKIGAIISFNYLNPDVGKQYRDAAGRHGSGRVG